MKKHIIRKSIASLANIGILATFILAAPAVADEVPQDKSDDIALDEADSGDNSIFDSTAVNGGFSEDGKHSGFTIGLEVEKYLSESFGIGAMVEYTGGDLDSLLFAVPVTYRLDNWKFQVAPGYVDSYRGKNYVTRFGTGYEFDIGDWIVTPNAKADVLAEDDSRAVLVYGVSISTEF